MNKTKFREEFCERLIEHMGKGYSYESFGADIKVGRATMYRWESQFPLWAAAKEIAMESSLKSWEKLLILSSQGLKVMDGDKVLDGKAMNASTIMFALKTRFRSVYKIVETVEHKDIEMPSDKEITLAEALQKKMGKKAKKELIEGIKKGIKKSKK